MGVNHTKEKADLMRRLWLTWFNGMTEEETLSLVNDLCEEYQAITDRSIETFIKGVKDREVPE